MGSCGKYDSVIDIFQTRQGTGREQSVSGFSNVKGARRSGVPSFERPRRCPRPRIQSNYKHLLRSRQLGFPSCLCITSGEHTDQGGPIGSVEEVTFQLYYVATAGASLHRDGVKASLKMCYWEKLDLLVEAFKSEGISPARVGTALLNTRNHHSERDFLRRHCPPQYGGIIL